MSKYESKVEQNRTVIHYTYDALGRVILETRIRLEPEAVEEPEKPSQYDGVIGWKMVDHDEVESHISQGYVVLQHWQKGALVVKREVNDNPDAI